MKKITPTDIPEDLIEQLAEKLQTDTATAADIIVWNANVVRDAVVDFDAERLHRWHLLNYLTIEAAVRHGPDGLAEGLDDLPEVRKPANPELPSLHKVLFSASGTFLGPFSVGTSGVSAPIVIAAFPA
jgi:hypothetical protein